LKEGIIIIVIIQVGCILSQIFVQLANVVFLVKVDTWTRQ
jgi:hypothetical protein